MFLNQLQELKYGKKITKNKKPSIGIERRKKMELKKEKKRDETRTRNKKRNSAGKKYRDDGADI